ncbi:hypothetical protein GWO43_13465 [candidate division KSB1 bacterium]|nr:hypothetical protein [candidate division KSB1 bacterium]NIS24938.1 hypothetical protein [candidate division KSB1 bacterium]NIT71858.1 hypothetical protein [candidate division KSB1 bacterium]NIU25591.1 hypothetical protein [candidate division KSB1 bacterium]NIV91988.1 hypothetical protein [candidate division KSB1 bacterium]
MSKTFFKRHPVYLFTAFLLILYCSSEKTELLPQELSGLKLSRTMNGQEAKNFVNRLHFQEVAASKNEIGFYEEDKKSAIIYISHYETAEQAETEERKMTDKISPQNSVFVGGKYLDVNGKQVYRCFGMGQIHFVFSHKRQLFWISVDTLMGKEFLSAYLGYLS